MPVRAIFVLTFCFLALALAPLGVQANDRGFYVGAGAGLNVPFDSDVGSAEVELDLDWVGSGSVGYAYGNGFRSELEVGFRPNDIDNVSTIPGGSGDVDTWNFMANVLYDLKFLKLPITPYVGVGLGAARVGIDGSAPVAGLSIDDHDFGFAIQAIGGASYDFTDNWSATLEYKYLNVTGLKFDANNGSSFNGDYATNQFMVGVRYRFGAPAAKPAPAPKPVKQPPPPPPPAAPKKAEPVPKDFLVFFDFDSDKLTPEALEIVRSAADQAKKGGYSRISLTGYTDRAGPASYNLGLSKRRANSVKAELVRLGVPGGEISTRGLGEANPLVPTADGVPEAQNRRVEIFMR